MYQYAYRAKEGTSQSESKPYTLSPPAISSLHVQRIINIPFPYSTLICEYPSMCEYGRMRFESSFLLHCFETVSLFAATFHSPDLLTSRGGSNLHHGACLRGAGVVRVCTAFRNPVCLLMWFPVNHGLSGLLGKYFTL